MFDEKQGRTIDVTDPVQLAEHLQWSYENIVRLGEAVKTLTMVVGMAAQAVDHCQSPHSQLSKFLLLMTDHAENVPAGCSREILDILRIALTTDLSSPPPKGGTHPRIVGGREGTEAKAKAA